MGNENGQMAKKDAPLRCPAMTPDKEPAMRCVWHITKHPEAHLAISHDHNAKDAILWYWFDPAKQLPAEKEPFPADIGNQCGVAYQWDQTGTMKCQKPKDHRGAHLVENDRTMASWGWNG